jgi:hypothetical protein
MLTEEIFVHRADDAGGGVLHRLEVVAANDDDGRAFGLAHEQARGGGKLIGDGQDGGMQRLHVAIVSAAKIDERGNAGNADGDVSETETPGTAKGIADNDSEPLTCFFMKRGGEAASGPVGIARKKRNGVHARNVGLVHSRVGADKTVMRLDDEHVLAADDAARLAENDFNQPRIFFQRARQFPGLRGWLHSRKLHDPSFGFRNNFLSDDKNVAVFERDLPVACSGSDFPRQVIAFVNFREARDAKKLDAPQWSR